MHRHYPHILLNLTTTTYLYAFRPSRSLRGFSPPHRLFWSTNPCVRRLTDVAIRPWLTRLIFFLKIQGRIAPPDSPQQWYVHR